MAKDKNKPLFKYTEPDNRLIVLGVVILIIALWIDIRFVIELVKSIKELNGTP